MKLKYWKVNKNKTMILLSPMKCITQNKLYLQEFRDPQSQMQSLIQSPREEIIISVDIKVIVGKIISL